MSRCSSCDAVIVWCRTTSGKSIPLDPDPIPNGNLVKVGREVHYVTADAALPLDLEGNERYVSHFATCPNASSHRKER